MERDSGRPVLGWPLCRAAWRAALACALLAGCSNFTVLGVLNSQPPPTPSTPSTLKLSPPTVNVLLGGTQKFTATGGSGGYTYSVLPGGAGGSVNPSTGLYTANGSAGTDSVIVTDSSGSVSESTAQVMATIPLSISPTSTTVNAGSAAGFTASGGTAPYGWTRVSGAGTLSGAGNAATYTAPWAAETAQIKVTDFTLSSATATVTVGAPTPVQISPSTVNLNAGGSVTFSASGATGNPANYVYTKTAGPGSLVGAAYTASWTAGAATVQVKDIVTLSVSSAAISINAPPALQISPASANINDNGSATFAATGGSGNPANYSYSLIGGLGSLTGSTYTPQLGSATTATVRVTDALTSQTSDATVIVTVPVALTISPKTVTLDAGGTVAFSAGGGAGGYAFSLIAGGGSLVGATYTAPWSATTATVRVTDSAAATDDATITVNAPPPLTTSPSSPVGLSAGQNVTFTATGGSGSYSWAKISGGGTLLGTTYTAPWTATTAQIQLTDTHTLQTLVVTVNVSSPPPLTITPSTIDVTAGDIVTFTAGGGSGSYSFSLVSGAGTLAGAGNTATYATVTAETADIRLTDTNTSSTTDATVTVYLPLTLIPATATVQVGGTYPFTTSGGKPPYVYAVASGGGSIDSSGLFTAPLSAGTSTIRVSDALSNMSTATITIQPAGTWSIVSIDASSRSGQYASLALDGSGLPKIAYYESQAKELRLAAYNGAWSWGTADSSGHVGQHVSLALMPGTGFARISYYDSTNRQLDYASWSGSSWGIQTVDTSGTVGLYTSLALDSGGNPRISYYDQSNNRLKLASWNGSSWSIQNVNSAGSGGMYTSLALDPATGYARISYYDNSNHLSFASWNGSTWSLQTVDSSGDVGMYSSLALEPGTGNARISHYDHGARVLRFTAWNGSTWTWSVPVVDNAGSVGSYSSLALVPGSNYPGISYYDATNKALKFALWNGSSWSTQTADSGSGNNVGQYSSLKFDAATHLPRIAYYDQTSQDLKFAKQ